MDDSEESGSEMLGLVYKIKAGEVEVDVDGVAVGDNVLGLQLEDGEEEIVDYDEATNSIAVHLPDGKVVNVSLRDRNDDEVEVGDVEVGGLNTSFVSNAGAGAGEDRTEPEESLISLEYTETRPA